MLIQVHTRAKMQDRELQRDKVRQRVGQRKQERGRRKERERNKDRGCASVGVTCSTLYKCTKVTKLTVYKRYTWWVVSSIELSTSKFKYIELSHSL